MNDAHYHLLANHLPIVGIVIGVLVLIVGLIVKKSHVKLTALGIFIFSALASVVAFYTGEGAEEIVEKYAEVSESFIHTHEENAESFFTLTLILGSISLIGFILELKKFKYAKYVVFFTLLLGIADGVLASYVGTSGGEIRHPEIRVEGQITPSNPSNENHEEESDHD